YVAFIDILGFSDLVTNSERDAPLFDELVQALTLIKWSRRSGMSFRYHAFSDSIVTSVDRNGDSLMELISNVSELCFRLLAMGEMTRGAIVVGKLYHDEGIVFGPGLIGAYQMEQR